MRHALEFGYGGDRNIRCSRCAMLSPLTLGTPVSTAFSGVSMHGIRACNPPEHHMTCPELQLLLPAWKFASTIERGSQRTSVTKVLRCCASMPSWRSSAENMTCVEDIVSPLPARTSDMQTLSLQLWPHLIHKGLALLRVDAPQAQLRREHERLLHNVRRGVDVKLRTAPAPVSLCSTVTAQTSVRDLQLCFNAKSSRQIWNPNALPEAEVFAQGDHDPQSCTPSTGKLP